MAIRFAVAAAVMLPFAPMPRAELGRIAIVSFFGATLAYGLVFTGMEAIDASIGVIVLQTEGPFALLVAAIFLKEKLGWRRLLGVAIAFAGVFLIAGRPESESAFHAVLLVLAGAFVWASAQVGAKTVSHIGGLRLIAWVAALATPQLFLASWIIEGDPLPIVAAADWRGWACAIYLGLLMTVLGYSLWYRLLGRYPVQLVSPILLLVPVTAVIGSVLFLGERPGLLALLGAAIVLLGVALSTIERPAKMPRAGELKSEGKGA